MRETNLKMLNIGCGDIFHPLWTNIDVESCSPYVLSHDLTRGLPFPSASFDVVYHSHVLEHLKTAEASFFLKEVERVLKPQGIFRVVVPDLEKIVRVYLQKLEVVSQNSKTREEYDWILLELFDQTTRGISGGEMAKYIKEASPATRQFITAQIGNEAEKIWKNPAEDQATASHAFALKPFLRKAFKKIHQTAGESLMFLMGGARFKRAFKEGLFRQSGEIHQRMYDRFSLRQLLLEQGFIDVRIVAADESKIPYFTTFELDTVGSRVRKPDSLFMECQKP